MNTDWITPDAVAAIPSPALLIDMDRVEENLRRMVPLAGNPARLRPHIKTHKLPQVLALHLKLGIETCKCATIAEAEMAMRAGMKDVLLALQPVGPNVPRVLSLIRTFPDSQLQIVVDASEMARTIGKAATLENLEVQTMIDLDVGQHRTGIAPGQSAIELYQLIAKTRGLLPSGIHAYDGHVHEPDLSVRREAATSIHEVVSEFCSSLLKSGLEVPRIVMGGTPTFPFYAKHAEVECSPGTCVLWDAGYSTSFADMDFLHAAALLTRVISHPGKDLICLDLGHKAVASEMPHPRVIFPSLPDAKAVAHNEEHLVIKTARAAELPLGAPLFGIPWHICPTVALYSTVHAVKDGRVIDEWPVVGRQRRLTI